MATDNRLPEAQVRSEPPNPQKYHARFVLNFFGRLPKIMAKDFHIKARFRSCVSSPPSFFLSLFSRLMPPKRNNNPPPLDPVVVRANFGRDGPEAVDIVSEEAARLVEYRSKAMEAISAGNTVSQKLRLQMTSALGGVLLPFAVLPSSAPFSLLFLTFLLLRNTMLLTSRSFAAMPTSFDWFGRPLPSFLPRRLGP